MERRVYSLAALPPEPTPFSHVAPARSHVDVLPREDGFDITGLMVLPDRELDSLDLYYDGEHVGTPQLFERADVAEAFAWIAHRKRVVFTHRLELMPHQMRATGRLEAVGTSHGEAAGYYSSLVRADLDEFPAPPASHSERVIGNGDPRQFRLGGIWMFGQFVAALQRHADPRRMRRILDWGCGSGRIAAHFLALEDGPAVFGCDIDAPAVAWCNENLPDGTFTVVAPMPPTPYPDGCFDAVIGCSVLTHLSAETQRAWLAELWRIVAPGGIVVVSVHGEFGAQFLLRTPQPSLPPSGITDAAVDHVLDGIAPDGYYRCTIQTREYTLREFGKFFEVEEYRERGVANFHDMVVLRRG